VLKLLIVKTSSMGDVVHTLPAVSDLLRHCPGAQVDWLVEAPFADIAELHPGVRRVLPLAWRKWRRTLLEKETWAAMAELRTQLREQRYDLALDLQGLLKSALWGRQAGAPLVGYDRASAREPLAALFYSATMPVPKGLHAVERSRQLVSMHLGYPLPADPPRFELMPAAATWPAPERYAALIPNASRPEKLWPESRWVAVGRRMRGAGLTPVVLWGTEAEQTMAERIAADCAGTVPPFLRVGEMAALLAGAVLIVGLDTGFSHLGAALGRPTIGIYCDHDPGLAGVTGPDPQRVASIGGKGEVPKLADVIALIESQLAALKERAAARKALQPTA
jgi:heptosyltransferase I